MDLVQGRECGECNVCCVATFIDTTEFRKLPGVRCRHLCAEGCSIYPTRYTACRTYHCGWRYLAFLSDHWRPDKSGVLIAFIPKDELPLGYAMGVSFILVATTPQGLTRALYHYVSHLLADGVYVTLAIAGPPGHYPAVTVLNRELGEGARTGDPSRIESLFARAWSGAKTHAFTPVSGLGSV